MGLADLMRAAKRELIITHRLERFLTEHGADFPVPEEVQAWAAQELATGGGPRPGWFRSSGLHFCHRRQVYAFKGTPQAGIETKLAQIFADGRYRHLRWQVMLLSAGILSEVEVGWRIPELHMSGTMDGVGELDGERWGFELKGANDNTYRYVATFDAPKAEHLLQVGAYFLGNPDIDRFSLVYENKNSNEYREFVVSRDDAPVDKVKDALSTLNFYLDTSTMPPVLEECQQRTGAYRSCPFATTCVPKQVRISK